MLVFSAKITIIIIAKAGYVYDVNARLEHTQVFRGLQIPHEEGPERGGKNQYLKDKLHSA